MKKILCMVVAVGLGWCIFQPVYGQSEPLKRFEFETGTAEYVVSGTESGVEILFFDKWGMREARYRRVEILNRGFSNTATIMDEDWVYTIDFDKHLGSKVENTAWKKAKEDQDPQLKFWEKIMKAAGAVKIDEVEGLLEKTCQIWVEKLTGQRWSVWEGVPLKIVQSFEGVDTTAVAVSFTENVPVDGEKFKIPSDIRFIEGDIRKILISQTKGFEKESSLK